MSSTSIVRLSWGLLVAATLGCGPSSISSGSFSTPPPPASAVPQTPRRSVENSLLDGGTSVELKDFKIRLPQGWERKQDLIVALHALPSGDQLYPNLKVAVVNLPKQATMMDSVTQSKKAYAKIWAIEEEKTVKINGASAHRMLLVQDIGLTKSRQIKYFIAAGDKALIVTGQSEPEEFDKHLPVFEAMVQSLEILTP